MLITTGNSNGGGFRWGRKLGRVYGFQKKGVGFLKK